MTPADPGRTGPGQGESVLADQAGAERGKVEQFLAVPQDAETCGPIVHDEERSVFVSVQHPGEDGTFEAPRSYFPDYVGAGAKPAAGQVRAPRPAVIQVFRG